MKKYDVVVIGAGVGGLTAAAHLAKSGQKVLLLEKHNLPGGCATSFRRGPFEFEATLHELCQMGQEGDTRRVVNDLELDVEWVSVDEAFRAIITDPAMPIDITAPVGISEFIEAVEQKVPGSRAPLNKMFEMAREIKDAIAWLAEHDNNPKGGEKLEFLAKYGNFLKMVTVSVDEMLRRIGMPDATRCIVEQYWDYVSVDSTRMSFAVYIYLLYIYLTQKPWIAKYRSHEISLALDDCIRKHGGDVWYNTPCVHIDVKDGSVQGVVTVTGAYIPCKHVICNLMPHVVFSQLVERFEVPLRDRKTMNARRFGQCAASVYLALDIPYSELGFEGYDVFVRHTGDTRKQYLDCAELSDDHDISINCLNAAIPDCTPEGTCMLQFTMFFDEHTFENVKTEEYFGLKNRIAEMCVKRFEELAHREIRGHIVEMEVNTPLTWARYLGTPNGTVYGYEPGDWDGMFARIQSVKEWDYTIEGLRFCGGHGAYMDGYSQSILSGYQAADFTMEDMKEDEAHGKV